MTRRRKFTPGVQLVTPQDAVDLILRGRWLYYGRKPMHPGWTGSWSLHFITVAVRQGLLRLAVPTEELKASA